MASLSPEDPRSRQLRDLILQLLPEEARSSLPPSAGGDALDQAIAGLTLLAAELVALRSAGAEAELHLEAQLGMIVDLVSFKYDTRVPVSDAGSMSDAFASGLNMLAEELATSTVSKDYVNNIIESMTDSLLVIDIRAQIRTVNQAACDLLGLSREELLSRPIDALFEGLSTADLIEEGGVRDQERRCWAEGGKSVPVAFSAAVMRDKAGAPEGLVCVARDLTEAKLTERTESPDFNAKTQRRKDAKLRFQISDFKLLTSDCAFAPLRLCVKFFFCSAVSSRLVWSFKPRAGDTPPRCARTALLASCAPRERPTRSGPGGACRRGGGRPCARRRPRRAG